MKNDHITQNQSNNMTVKERGGNLVKTKALINRIGLFTCAFVMIKNWPQCEVEDPNTHTHASTHTSTQCFLSGP